MGRINDYLIVYAVQGQTLGGFRTVAYKICNGLSYLWMCQAREHTNFPEQEIENHKAALKRLAHYATEAPGTKSDDYFEGECIAFIEKTAQDLSSIDHKLLTDLAKQTISYGTIGILNFLRNELDSPSRKLIELSFQLPKLHKTELWQYYSY